MLNPVAFPPGRARLSTRPAAADDRHDDRDGCGRGLERLGGRRSTRDDDVDVALGEFGGEPGKPFGLVLPPSPLERDRAPLGIAELLQPFDQGFGAKRKRRRRPGQQDADPRQLAGLLRVRGAWPCD